MGSGFDGPWRQSGSLLCCLPSNPCGVLQFIGGSYLSTAPQLSYRRFLESWCARDWAVLAWSYIPGFDHQAQADEAFTAFERGLRLHGHLLGIPIWRMGHSLGCKLHLLAPDGGEGCAGALLLSFNNFSAERSVPMLADLAPRLGVASEFSPSPNETLRLVSVHYRQPRNLLVRFQRDTLDQSGRLLGVLRNRLQDHSELLVLPGDHLTPASAGLRQSILGAWADAGRADKIDRLVTQLWGRL